jgi:integrase
MVDRGYSAESISKMLGHASFDMTQKHYARISEARIENEYLKMNGKN